MIKRSSVQVVVAVILIVLSIVRAGRAAQSVTVMPLGDSLTVGIDFTPNSKRGGYRDPLHAKLVAAGITPKFIGVGKSNATPLLNNAGNEFHNGYNGYRIAQITANLDGNLNVGDGNNGGYWITGGHGTGRNAVSPDIVLITIGGNDINAGDDLPNINNRIQTLVTTFHTLSPGTKVLIAGTIPMADAAKSAQIKTYNEYIRDTLVPTLSYARYVDLYSAFLNADGSLKTSYLSADGIHPSSEGYEAMATVWSSAITQAVPEPTSLAPVGGAMVLCTLRKRRAR